MNTSYDDIIGLKHHISAKRRPMAVTDRAAQFAPFSALTGYEGAILETGRLTEEKIEISDERKGELDRKQAILLGRIQACPEVTVTWFQPDARKSGGQYITVRGNLKSVDPVTRYIHLVDGRRIPLDEIVELDSRLFCDEE